MNKERMQNKKQLIAYIFWGCITSFINFSFFIAFSKWLKLSASVSNILAWLFSVIFAFITNKIYVFADTEKQASGIAGEFFCFILLRFFSGLIETVLLYVFADIREYNDIIVKLAGSIFVVILNYITSRWIVFTGKRKV